MHLFSVSLLFHTFLVSTYIIAINSVQPSSGCYRSEFPKKFKPGKTANIKRKLAGTQRRKHSITLPKTYDEDPSQVEKDPPPLFLFFHGYGGDYRSCKGRCKKDIPDNGIVSVRMTGYGPKWWNSWKFDGSSSDSSGGDFNSTTCDPDNVYGNYCPKYKECDCSQSNGCWWTTCHDSVAQVVDVLDFVGNKLCVDLDRVWASGCSNGGMFTHELARDSRTASRLRGIAPIVGLPHWGYSDGPFVEGISYFAMLGAEDTVVPPIANLTDFDDTPDKTIEHQGWWYTSYNKTVADWTSDNGCSGDGQTLLDESEYDTGAYGLFDCVQGCEEKKNTSHVVGCLFPAGHECYTENVPWEPLIQFILSQD